MSECLALEKAYGAPYGQWERDLAAGSMRAMCGLVWLVWRRDGRDTELRDILSGDVEVELAPFLADLAALNEETEAEAGPTADGGKAPAPDGTPTPPGSTSPSSPRSSASGRGRSRS